MNTIVKHLILSMTETKWLTQCFFYLQFLLEAIADRPSHKGEAGRYLPTKWMLIILWSILSSCKHNIEQWVSMCFTCIKILPTENLVRVNLIEQLYKFCPNQWQVFYESTSFSEALLCNFLNQSLIKFF